MPGISVIWCVSFLYISDAVRTGFGGREGESEPEKDTVGTCERQRTILMQDVHNRCRESTWKSSVFSPQLF
jgi:hypothetical protein